MYYIHNCIYRMILLIYTRFDLLKSAFLVKKICVKKFFCLKINQNSNFASKWSLGYSKIEMKIWQFCCCDFLTQNKYLLKQCNQSIPQTFFHENLYRLDFLSFLLYIFNIRKNGSINKNLYTTKFWYFISLIKKLYNHKINISNELVVYFFLPLYHHMGSIVS